jgi:hypothetical protein
VITLPAYSLGIGDRFGRQGKAQLAAMVRAAERGVRVAPVWNKSHREHSTIGSRPAETRAEADAAVRALGWTDKHFVDADHIRLETVEAFLESADFFTLDVAEFIGQPAPDADLRGFAARVRRFEGSTRIPGIEAPLRISRDDIGRAAAQYLLAAREAGRIYRRIAERRGPDFITEVSMDEADAPQGPSDLLLILAALAEEGIPVQTLAPRFSGRFNKGVDYAGDPARFEREFRADVAVAAFASREFGLPASLKLSVHSGSDKFTLYPILRRILRDTGAGLHLKTAGTTWLEELAGLATSGDEGLGLAREIYRAARARMEALCAPYASVIDLAPDRLPPPDEVDRWDGEAFAAALVHDPAESRFNPHFRQLLHVAYKVAAEMGERYLSALDRNAAKIAPKVTDNLYVRHLQPLFLAS